MEKLLGKAVVTLQKWDWKGIRRAYRTATNRRYYNHEQYLQVIGQKAVEQIIIRYCRVSSSGQKGDLASQKRAVEQFCIATDKAVAEKIEDVWAEGLPTSVRDVSGFWRWWSVAR